MKKFKGLDFIVDKLTNSIENVITGDSFQTEISVLSKTDLKGITKSMGWTFNWKTEFNDPVNEVYKLNIIYMHLVENAPFNRGKSKMYSGVAGNLVAFACKLSFQRGHQGNIAFISKTQLIDHYVKTLGAFHIGGRVLAIESKAAQILIDKYFQN